MKPPARFQKVFNNQQGFVVASFVAIFVGLLVFFLIPRKYAPFQEEASGSCSVGTPPAQARTIRLPNIKGMDIEPGLDDGGPIMDQLVDFVLIRENVPVLDTNVFFKAEEDSPPNEHTFRVNYPSMPDRVLYYPGKYNHFAFYRKFNASYDNGDQDNSMSYRNEGIVVAVHLKADGTQDIETLTETNMRGTPVRKADYYQAKAIFDKPKDYTTEEFFHCSTELGGGNDSNVMIPDQAKSANNEQMQLEWFLINQGQSQGYMYPHCKPAIYLYPPHKQLVNVKVFPQGTLTYTDPIYDSKTGWTVKAYPDGNLTTLPTTYNLPPTTYPYLYFESKVQDEAIRKPTKGWIVQSSVISHQSSARNSLTDDRQQTTDDYLWFAPLEQHFNHLLPQLGLNQTQTKDFIDYWRTGLPYSPYYFIGVIDQDNVNQFERLEITPQPDTINRVRIYFERLDSPREVEAPLLKAESFKLQASSFNVVEWGGMVKTDPNHPFTCSQ